MATDHHPPFRRIRFATPATTILALAMALALTSAIAEGVQPAQSEARVVHVIDFTGRAGGKAGDWLRNEGYEFKLDADALDPRFSDQGLVLSTEGQEAGLIARDLKLDDAGYIRVTWGVNRYPEGANWEKGVYRVPVAVMVSFGDKEIGSGSLFVPNMPYFISLFLSENARPGKAYKANYYKKGGRYFCQPCTPPAGETVTTEFDLHAAFRESFGSSDVPPITRFGFQMNTEDTKGGAEAYIQRVEFLAR